MSIKSNGSLPALCKDGNRWAIKCVGHKVVQTEVIDGKLSTWELIPTVTIKTRDISDIERAHRYCGWAWNKKYAEGWRPEEKEDGS